MSEPNSIRLHLTGSKAAGLILFLLVIAAYAATLGAPLTGDDLSYVRDAAILRLPLADFWRAIAGARYFEFTQERTYQPLVTLFHYLFRESPSGMRFAGFGLHAANSFLLFLTTRKLTKSGKAALAAAALFALFPANTETIDTSAFKGHLFAFGFGLAALLFWLDSLESPEPRRSLAGCVVFYSLALLSKETGVLTLGLAAAHALGADAERRRRVLRFSPLLLVPTALYLYVRFRWLVPPPPELHGSANPAAVFGWYLRLLAFPQPLCLERTFESAWWLYALAAAFAAALVCAWRRPTARLGLLWIALGLLPYIQIIPFSNYSAPGFVLVADRYLYWAAAGLCLAVGPELARPGFESLLGALLLLFGASTLHRNLLTLDEKAFLEQTVACAPRHPRAWARLGGYLADHGEFERARDVIGEALHLDPNYVQALNEMGLISVHFSRPVEAQGFFERSLRVTETALVHLNLGNVLGAQGRDSEALGEYRRASEMEPQWPLPYANAALILAKTDPAKAEAFRRAAREAAEGAGR